jgi:septal ring factor EnvC (AmiA/AmiB activator)
MHAVFVRERKPMRRKLLVLFVVFASVFGVVACGGEVEVQEKPKEEAEEAKEEAEKAKKEVQEAEEELKEATEQLKEVTEELKEVPQK